MSETTTISVRVPEEEKEDFRQIADAIGVSMQKILEEYIDRVVDHEDEIKEAVVPATEQVNEIVGVFVAETGEGDE